MRPPFTLLLALAATSGALTADQQQQRQYAPYSLASGGSEDGSVATKRASTACEQTYGPGSVECGNAQATMCYNPSLGQSCCADNGYCDKGQYCAPVAGYCCLESEDLQACAANAGFELPASVLSSLGNTTNATAPGTAATGGSSTAPNPVHNSSHAGSTPYVQVSAVARKEQWTLVWMSMGIGIVGVIMATF